VFTRPCLRYPFLFRPLVEHALCLPPRLRGGPYTNKLVLRRALGDDLPALVRERTGKGSIGTRVVWSLTHEATTIDRLIQDPILADLGCISAPRLVRAMERARGGSTSHLAGLIRTLSLELWLRVRSNQWVPLKQTPNRMSVSVIPEETTNNNVRTTTARAAASR